MKNILLLLFLPAMLLAQKQGNVWHFGDGRSIDFSTGAPLNLTGSSVITFEGSASYCDKYGNFLFYTNGGGREPAFSGQDGGKIWNRNNAVMYDMLGTEGGGFSSAQSAVIFEAPGQDSVYYVFTMDEIEYTVGASPAIQASQPFGRGLSYFTVDMRLNGGLGGVVLADQRVKIPSAEGLCAIRHANERDYWIIINQDSTGLGVYSVTPSGVALSNVYAGVDASTIKASPNGAKVFAGTTLLNFNNSTGILSTPISLSNADASKAEFSPNSRFLYNVEDVSGTDNMIRYDLQATNISGSASSLGTINLGIASSSSQMQLAPDGRIYFLVVDFINDTKYINRINCPNTFGATLQLNVLNYISYDLFFGLPNFSNWLFENYDSTYVALGPDTVRLCDVGGTYSLNAQNPGATYLWSNGATTQTITATAAGTYSVTVTGTCGIGTDQVVISTCGAVQSNCIVFQPTGAIQQWTVPVGVDSITIKMWGAAGGGGPDSLNNGGGGGGYTNFTMPVSAGQVLDISVGVGGQAANANIGGVGGWPNGGNGGSGNRNELNFGIPTDVGGAGGGGGRTEIRLGASLLAIAGAGGGAAYNRYGGGGGGLNAEYTAASNSFNIFGFGGTQTAGGAPSSNTICGHPVSGTAGSALQGGTGATDLGGSADRTGGGGGGDGLFGGGGGGSHDGCFGVGSTGGGGSGFLCATCPGLYGTTTTAGFFGVPANNSDPLLAAYPNTALGINSQNGGGGLVQICWTQSISCAVTNASITVTACNSYTAASGAIFSSTGTYSDTITNAGGCDSIISINLTINVAPTVTITGASNICTGSPQTLTANITGTGTFLWSTGATTSTISITTGANYSVTVSNSCGSNSASISVTASSAPTVNISGNSSFCTGSSEILTANITGSGTYLWSNGATTANINVLTGGTYNVTVSNSCGSNAASFVITEVSSPTASISGTNTICAGASEVLTANGTGNSYLWSTGATTQSININAAGTYTVTISAACGNASATLVVNPISAPTLSLSGDSVICDAATGSILANATAAQSYLWSTGATTPSITINSAGIYSVTVSNACGQVNANRTVTEITDCDSTACAFLIPNAFTPNADGTNDNWYIQCIELYPDNEVEIYNRWGQKVYAKTSYTGDWNGDYQGSPLPDAAYFYILKITFPDGERVFTGSIAIIR